MTDGETREKSQHDKEEPEESGEQADSDASTATGKEDEHRTGDAGCEKAPYGAIRNPADERQSYAEESEDGCSETLRAE
ncbi:hypothetical protein ACFVUS_40735 [Nocardia sp. NPDC058058]|uniref:hypothetical protein n=1 Tax=Nocardia sp. NPDC058058 TaxID=3346317 RepID=UPI0036DA7258